MKPFLKWAGGKTQLLPVLMKDFPSDTTRYAEPFVGAGAMFFHLLETQPQIEEWYISDVNSALINIYSILASDGEEAYFLIDELKSVQSHYNDLDAREREKFFYHVREQFNKSILKGLEDFESNEEMITYASQAIFLNKTSFNGLWRVTKAGLYNTPFNFLGVNKKTGVCRNANICNEENLLRIAKKLSKINLTIRLTDFAKGSLDFCLAGDSDKTLFYFDPPYRPVKEGSFTAYAKAPFNDKQQVILSRLARNLIQRGSKVLLSNSNCEDGFLETIYPPSYFNIETVSARRSINSKGSDRKGTEVIISDYRGI